jgi:hypothetical protein
MDPVVAKATAVLAGGGCESLSRDAERTPTSVLLEQLSASACPSQVTLEWLFEKLHGRSFGILMLVLGLVAVLPGIGVVAGIILVAFSIQMLMGREAPVLPGFIASRPFAHERFAVVMMRAIPVVRILEQFIRPRWRTPMRATKRVVGLILLLMAVTLFVPVPLSNILPGVMTVFVALAYLEEDGLLLSLALVACLASLGVILATVWETSHAVLFHT